MKWFLICEKWPPDDGESCTSGKSNKVVTMTMWKWYTWLDGTVTQEKGRSLWRAISSYKNLGISEGLRLYIPWECEMSTVFVEHQDV